MAATTQFIIVILVHIFTTSFALRPTMFSSILIFGDSTVDTGNNNYILTLFKGNHYPYGRNFPGHVPTGRFSNGKLVPDFIASMLNLKDIVPPFLEPNLPDYELLTGVSFASAGSGYDEFTTAASGIIPVSKQLEYFRDYVATIKGIVGEDKARRILESALVVISAGTNDFTINFYDIPTRKFEFNVTGYQDFLLNKLQIYIKELYDLGCRKIAVAGLPPVGCIPLEITTRLEKSKDRKCLENENLDAQLYNRKLERLLLQTQAMLPGTRVVYADVYQPLINLINEPETYGFEVTKKGCCGTGIFEAGPFCNKNTLTCEDASSYVFWDSIHPTEAAYQYIAKYLEREIVPKFQHDMTMNNSLGIVNVNIGLKKE